MAEQQPQPGSPRERLLDAAAAHVAEHGVGDLTLRGLAAAIGTSHRMLLYHFGSRDELLLAVIRRAEAQQRAIVAGLDAQVGPELTVAEAIWAMWEQVSSPALSAHERLFFEVYGQALQGRPHATPLLEDIVDAWLEPLTALVAAHGLAPDAAAATARLGLAVTRGLLLDLLATGDREGVDAACRRWIELYVLGLPRTAGP